MAVIRTLEGERVGALIVDPGTTTGAGYGIFNLKGESSFAIAKLGLERTLEINYVGDTVFAGELASAEHLSQLWLELVFRWNVEEGISKENLFFVFEDFILRPGKEHSSVRTGISPARIMGMVMGMLYEYDVQFIPQQPSDAKRIDNKRLKLNDLWVVGSEHRRDVLRHTVVFVRRAMQGKL